MRRHFFYSVLAICTVCLPFIVFAATSTNYDTNKDNGGPIDFQAESANYEFNAEVGHPGVGVSTSTNYEFWHGTFWEDATSSMNVYIQWAVPESRVGATSTNDDAIFYLTFRTADNSDDAILYQMPDLKTTNIDGTYSTSITITGLSSDTYDVGIKTHQHITKVLQDVTLTESATTRLNFTQSDNSTSYGSIRLLAGDISGTTSTPADLGDDVINSVDLSIMITDLDKNDPSGNSIRSNLNQDPAINSVDLSLLLKNLDLEGDN